MTPRSVLFWQPAGIGDIFFLQKAARHFISLGYEVIWPVIPDFLYIKDYIKGINFVNENEDFPHKEFYKTSTAINTEEFVYIPFDISHHRFGVPPMKGKYMLMQFMIIFKMVICLKHLIIINDITLRNIIKILK